MRSIRIGKRQLVPVGIVAASLLIIVLTLNAGHIKNQLNDWKLLPQPERLTELYYKDHATLPTAYVPGSIQQFSFITHNLEYRRTSYRYQVIQQSEDGSQRQVIQTGQFDLANDGYQTTNISLTPIDYGNRLQIVTTLSHSDNDASANAVETIHYWINRKAGV